MPTNTPSIEQLKRALAISEQIETLQAEFASILGGTARASAATAVAKSTEKASEKPTEKSAAGETAAPVKKAKGRKAKGPSLEEVQNAKFKELTDKIGEAKAQPYRMASSYNVDAKIEHPKFGVGFVASSFPDKIEVVFQDINRLLVQGRK